MYPISNDVKELFDGEKRQTLRITGKDKKGASISITEADVLANGFNVDRYSCNGERLEIGTAIAAEMTVKLDNRTGKYNGVVFEGAELFAEIGIADWTKANPTVNWIACGYFIPDEQPRSLSTITLHALDRMMKFNKRVQDGELSLPDTIVGIVRQTCAKCGVTLETNLSKFPNASYTVSALPSLQQEITYRNLIQWCAGIMGTNAWIDWNGKLRFSWYDNAADYVTTTSNRFNSDLFENDITITGVKYTNTQNITIVSGDNTYALDMTGNYLAESGIAQILPAVNKALNGYAYRPFNATVMSAPYLWPMDVITFKDKDGGSHKCALTNVNFTINGNTALESRGQTSQTNDGTDPSSFTTQQALLIEGATQASADKVKDAMTQEDIFNLLTNNGEIQGLLLYNGKVYLNASYIKSGELDASLITTGILNADLIQTGTLSADRIAGGTITSSKLSDAVNNSISSASSAAASAQTAAANAQSAAEGAKSDAADAKSAVGAANSSEQTIYRSAASGTTSMSGTTTWITSTEDTQNVWRAARPTYNSNYPVLFVATQRRSVNGTVTCTTPVIDRTTTVIDGGHITTGTIDAARINAADLRVNAANVVGVLAIGQLPDTVAEESDIPTAISELTNDSGFQTATQVTTIANGVISTAKLNANNITTGKISDKTGKNYWDLDKGEFSTTQASIGDFTLSGGKLAYGSLDNGKTGAEISNGGITFASTYSDGNTPKTKLVGPGVEFYWNGVEKFLLYLSDGDLSVRSRASDGSYDYPMTIFNQGAGQVYFRRNVFVEGEKNVTVSGNVTAKQVKSTNPISIGSGGTGLSSSPSMLTNLGSTSAANVLQASPRPGVTGTLAVGHGGTGATTAAAARTNLGVVSVGLCFIQTNSVAAGNEQQFAPASIKSSIASQLSISSSNIVGYVGLNARPLSTWGCQPLVYNYSNGYMVVHNSGTVADTMEACVLVWYKG